MTEPDCSQVEVAPSGLNPEIDAQIASLRTAGVERFDPVRWSYIEALAKRTLAHQGNIREVLDARLAQAIAAFQERFAVAQREAKELAGQHGQHYPHAASELQRHIDAGDFKGLHRLLAALNRGDASASLSALVRELEQHAAGNAEVHMAKIASQAGSRPELKALRDHRNTWAKLSVDKQVAQALEQAPKNAGPINSHMLMLRSLALMRDISPDYLNRFISYADALLSLDQGEKEKPTNPKKSQTVKAAKK
ncbi:DUF2894 family protein [Paucimonas lemoignei]|uniref:DUF2894 family protein n=1 Tax=Paucimonas lemoignei TaxID=29443 RepID=A0A4R3I0N8_PAULE|nr:DUF2894 domain-containing protein [Paucimonas lemoignei]TCS37379.1 DUF2894 family protein [Paucimonas lemoignei]